MNLLRNKALVIGWLDAGVSWGGTEELELESAANLWVAFRRATAGTFSRDCGRL